MSGTFNISFPVNSADVGAIVAALTAMNINPEIKHVPAAASAPPPAQSVRLPVQSTTQLPVQSVRVHGPQVVTATMSMSTNGPATPSTTSTRSGSAVPCTAQTKKGVPCRAWACEDAKNAGVNLCKVHYKAT